MGEIYQTACLEVPLTNVTIGVLTFVVMYYICLQVLMSRVPLKMLDDRCGHIDMDILINVQLEVTQAMLTFLSTR